MKLKMRLIWPVFEGDKVVGMVRNEFLTRVGAFYLV